MENNKLNTSIDIDKLNEVISKMNQEERDEFLKVFLVNSRTIEGKEELAKMPSSYDMIGILALFTGRNLKDMYENRFLESIEYYNKKINRNTVKRIYLVCDNIKIFAKAEVEDSLFDHLVTKDENEFSYYINKHFGARGLKHLLGFLVHLSEKNRYLIEFDIKDHLKRLGYKTNKEGYYPIETYQETIEFLKLLSSIKIIIEYKDKGRDKAMWNKLFNIEGGIDDLEKRIHEKLFITPTAWFQETMGYDSPKPQFTYFMKSLAKENYYERRETILSVIFPIYWRMNRNSLSFKDYLNYLNIDLGIKNGQRNLNKVYNELDYMVEKEYIEEYYFSINGKQAKEPNLKDLKTNNYIINFFPPKVIEKELSKIKTFIKPKEIDEINFIKELKILMGEKSIGYFSKELGISKSLLSQVLSEKKPISKKLKTKILEYKKTIKK